jgi:hypothetical protein
MTVASAGCAAAASSPVPTATALSSPACPTVERPLLQTGSHLIGDAPPPVPWSSVPASSGWHGTTVPRVGIHTAPLADADLVSLLEVGVVVLAHAPDAAPDDEIARALTTQFPDRLAIAPYEGEMASPVALVTWGTIARCDRVDPAAVTEFVVDWRMDASGGHT